MKKIPSVFKRDYDGTRLVYDERVEGTEWVATEGRATIKIDGTSCLYKDGLLWKRYDRKVKNKKAKAPYSIEDFKPAPDGWIQAEETPNIHTGHFPGWLPVSKEDPADKYHIEAFWNISSYDLVDGATYELIGEKIQGNPYNIEGHELVRHGAVTLKDVPRDFEGLRDYLSTACIEGIVFYHPDGRMAKIKSKDFGIDWITNLSTHRANETIRANAQKLMKASEES